MYQKAREESIGGKSTENREHIQDDGQVDEFLSFPSAFQQIESRWAQGEIRKIIRLNTRPTNDSIRLNTSTSPANRNPNHTPPPG
jgi:hypothetical protein